MTRRLVLLGEALVAAAAAGVAIAAVAGHWHGAALYVGLAALVVIGGAPTRLAARARAVTRSAGDADATGRPAPRSGPIAFTTVVRAGGEPRDVLESAVALAAHLGPVVVIGRDDRALDVHGLGVPSYTAPTVEEALRLAARDIITDATLIVSGRAVPAAAGCEVAAHLLTDDVGWVDGAAGTLNEDAYVDDRAARLTERLRARAHEVGVDLWEPDATVVRTTLLHGRPVESGRPWGRWLRAHRADGWRGIAVEDPLSLRLAPSAEVAFWPDTTARQRAAVADAADAVRTTRGRARRGAIALLLHELVAWRLAAAGLLLLPMFADRSAGWVVAPSTAAGIVAAVGAWRWYATRRCLDLAPRPRADLVATLYRLPGSMVSLGPAVTARVRPLRISVPTRPLAWSALLFTAVSGANLVGRTAEGTSTVRSITLTLVLLGLVWAFAVRTFLRRNWSRTTFRVPLDLAVRVAGEGLDVEARIVDASPRGLSLRLPGSVAVQPGDPLHIEVPRPDGSALQLTGGVAGVRTRSAAVVAGVRLVLDPHERGPWLQLVVGTAAAAPRHLRPGRRLTAAGAPTAALADRPRAAVRWTDRFATAVGAVMSVGVLACLVLVLSGYHTLVIRSGSMEPTFGIGAVVIGEPVPASAMRPGDIVTVDRGAVDDDSLTHRVRSVRTDGDELVVTTRGDANRQSETWTVPADRMLVRARWHVPWIGRPALALRDGTLGEVFVVAGALLLVGTVTRAAWRGRGPAATPSPA